MQIHAKNYKGSLKKIKYEINQMLEILSSKYHFINQQDNQTRMVFEINKDLNFSLKFYINLVNLKKTFFVTEINDNIFSAINNIRQKLEKQLQKSKDLLDKV